jgi:predicted PurR-regulated permease PerM
MPGTTDAAPTALERRALRVLALVALAALVWMSLPVASGLFLGTLLALALLGPYEWGARRLKSPGLAAVLLSVGSGLVLVGALGVLAYFVIDRCVTVANDIAAGFEPEGPLRKGVERLEDAARASPLGIDLVARVRDFAATAASRLTDWASAIAGATFHAVLVLFFTITSCFFVLRHWTGIGAHAERLLPLHPRHTRAVFFEFRSAGKQVLVGTLVTGLAQGVLGGIGYAIAGLPDAVLLGALTAAASLIPAVGPVLVWVPAGVILIFSGHVTAGIFVLAWGALVVSGTMEYLIRPKLLGRRRQIPRLLTFIALFGGVAVFGVVGLVVGPVIASVAFALLRTYEKENGSTNDLEGVPASSRAATAPPPVWSTNVTRSRSGAARRRRGPGPRSSRRTPRCSRRHLRRLRRRS